VESDIAHVVVVVVVVPSLGYNNMVEEEEEEIDSDAVILKNLMNQCLSVR
jgi:hypothetical protein